ncbi:GNAT family N-acetyltransferase [Streptomyces sp. NPDC059134]|uniref:GNAT family N-acetyltransferase n=1 Tax=Streptomyces sp. NPDC059134 TaxID=3346738 RepID=UPI00367DAE7C
MARQHTADDLEARPLDQGSVADWQRLRAEIESVDGAGEHVSAEDLVEMLEDPKLDPARDSLGLWSGSRLVAYAVLHTPHGAPEVARFQGDAAVHPDRRRHGIGTRLVEWLEARAETRLKADPQLSALRGELLLDGLAGDPGLLKLAQRQGFRPCRWWFDMKQPAPTGDRSPEPRPAPEGTLPVAFDATYDEATRLAHNDAFRDHWNFTPFDATDWRTWVTGAGSFRPAMSRLLIAGDEVVAYLLAEESEAETAETGSRDCHVGFLGTRRSWRGRGAAQALLTDVLRTAGDAGYDTVSLTVDTDNPSGALGMYERSGFAATREAVTYARPLGRGAFRS